VSGSEKSCKEMKASIMPIDPGESIRAGYSWKLVEAVIR